MNFDLLLGQAESFDVSKEDYLNADTKAPVRVRFSEPLTKKDQNSADLDAAEPNEAQISFMFGPGDKKITTSE